MPGQKRDTVFTEAKGKTVESITYQENLGWQALEIAFSNGTLFSFELIAIVAVQASYMKIRRGNLKSVRSYGRVSGKVIR